MAKHTVRVPAKLWDEWQPKLTPEEWSRLILGMLATAASDQIRGPGGAQRAGGRKADQRALLRGTPDARRRQRENSLTRTRTSSSAHQYYEPSRSPETGCNVWPVSTSRLRFLGRGSSKLPRQPLGRVGPQRKETQNVRTNRNDPPDRRNRPVSGHHPRQGLNGTLDSGACRLQPRIHSRHSQGGQRGRPEHHRPRVRA